MIFRYCFALYLLGFYLSFSQIEYETLPPDYIRTITFKGNTNEGQLPILRLGEYFSLEFDVLNGEEDDYYYVIDYYNFDWTPTSLVKSEYLRGLDNLRIPLYENSLNTYQLYSHYKLELPTRQTRLLISGNYMIKIYNEDEELMFSRKFMVYEDLAKVTVNIKRSRNVKHIYDKQTVDFGIISEHIRFINPNETVKVIVLQNNNLKTAITNLKPLYTLGNELIYKYTNEASFWAGNEYLFFDTKEVRAANLGIRSIALEDIYNTYLYTDIIRTNLPYTYNPDINGNFLITAFNAYNIDIEADYTKVHFSLLDPNLNDNETIHVYGNFNNYEIIDETQLKYNSVTKLYENNLLLKQGFYNYKYVVVDDNNLYEGAISGNFHQTENNYKVLVYYRDLGGRYDKIIGLGEGSSINISN